MREIKFRIWDSINKVFEDYYVTPQLMLEGAFEDGLLNVKPIFLQYTGLKDKNGEEIYEGDIIAHFAFKDFVVFRNGVFTTERNVSNQSIFTLNISDHGEVIGNVYENPELLK